MLLFFFQQEIIWFILNPTCLSSNPGVNHWHSDPKDIELLINFTFDIHIQKFHNEIHLIIYSSNQMQNVINTLFPRI